MAPLPVMGPRGFERYTDEFLYEHPTYKVTTEAPLRVQVPTRKGPEDDAVAVAVLEGKVSEACDQFTALQHAHHAQLHAATHARLAWAQRRSVEPSRLNRLGWGTAHFVASLAVPLFPTCAVESPGKRASTWCLLAHHLGTDRAARKTAQLLAKAHVRLVTLQGELHTLTQDLADLQTAVRRDHSVRVKTPHTLADFPKFRNELVACIATKARAQQALASGSLVIRERRLKEAFPRAIQGDNRKAWIEAVYAGDSDIFAHKAQKKALADAAMREQKKVANLENFNRAFPAKPKLIAMSPLARESAESLPLVSINSGFLLQRTATDLEKSLPR